MDILANSCGRTQQFGDGDSALLSIRGIMSICRRGEMVTWPLIGSILSSYSRQRLQNDPCMLMDRFRAEGVTIKRRPSTTTSHSAFTADDEDSCICPEETSSGLSIHKPSAEQTSTTMFSVCHQFTLKWQSRHRCSNTIFVRNLSTVHSNQEL